MKIIGQPKYSTTITIFGRRIDPLTKPTLRELLQDVKQVGPRKPLGYIVLCFFSEQVIIDTIKEMYAKGLGVRLFSQSECNIHSGALFVFDEIALQQLIDQNREVLTRAGVPLKSREFVNHIACTSINHADDAYRIVGLAFADPRFI